MKEYRYELKVIDDATDEVIYSNTTFSQESLAEKFSQIDRVIEKLAGERQDEGEPTPEELQEKADEARHNV